jgi:hypothetical protein
MRKKNRLLSFFLFGFSTLFILCLKAIGLVTWDNAHSPRCSIVTDKLYLLGKARHFEAQQLRQIRGFTTAIPEEP